MSEDKTPPEDLETTKGSARPPERDHTPRHQAVERFGELGGEALNDASDRSPAIRPRRPWLAFVLSWIVPGLGHAYAGMPLRGVAAALLYFVVIMPVRAQVRVPLDFSRWAVVLGVLIFICIGLLIPIDAARVARRRRTLPMTRWNRLWVYALHAIVVAALIMPAIHWWADHLWFRTFKIPSGAMMDTLLIGDYIIADMRSGGLSSLRRGEIVVFRHPQDTDVLYIKRLIGLPGETIELRDGFLYVDGQQVEEPYVPADYRDRDPKRNFGPVLVGPDHHFVLGDHRNQSADSRFWGEVPTSLLEGTARSIWWSYEEQPSYILQSASERLKRRLSGPFRLLTRTRWDRLGRRLERPDPDPAG